MSNYYITPATGSSSQLELGCGRENQHPAEGALRPPIEQLQLEFRSVGEKMLEWGPRPREAGPLGLRLSSPGERERNAVKAIRVGGGSICCSSVQSPTHLSNSKTFSNPFEPFQIKWEVSFSKELCRTSLLCRHYDSACICICIMWLNNKFLLSCLEQTTKYIGPYANSHYLFWLRWCHLLIKWQASKINRSVPTPR